MLRRPRAASTSTERWCVLLFDRQRTAAGDGCGFQFAAEPASRCNYTPLLRTALFTGLRLGELLGLQWQDVDLREGVLHVRRQHTRLGEYAPPKTKAAVRRIPLSEEMTRALAALRLHSRYSDDDDPVFAGRTGKPLKHRNATRRCFENAAARRPSKASRSTRCGTCSPRG